MKPANLTRAMAEGLAMLQPGLLARLTTYPWVVELRLLTNGRQERTIKIVQCPTGTSPEPEDMVPDGSTLNGYSVFMAERFQTIPVLARGQWKPHRREWLMWIRAKDLGMQASDMQPWLHYDPVQIDEDVERWAHGPNVRFAGD